MTRGLLQWRARPGKVMTACWESGVMALRGASGDQWAVPRWQSSNTEPYWEPGEEEGVPTLDPLDRLVISSSLDSRD